MMTKKKKGFTIVELVIVIAVIGILAAVLIPTFTSLVEEAKKSNDQQLVYHLNMKIKEVEIDRVAADKDAKANTMHETLEAMDKKGFGITKLTPTSNGDILWDSKTNRFVLVDADGIVLYYDETVAKPDTTTAAGKVKLWKVYNNVSEIVNNSYSAYLNNEDYDGDVVVTGIGFDVGNNTSITSVKYNDGNGKSVVIRTNSYETVLTIDAEHDTVTHYDKAKNIDVKAVDNTNCYNEHGDVLGNINLTKGKVVVHEGCKATAVVIDMTAEQLATVTSLSADNSEATYVPIILNTSEVLWSVNPHNDLINPTTNNIIYSNFGGGTLPDDFDTLSETEKEEAIATASSEDKMTKYVAYGISNDTYYTSFESAMGEASNIILLADIENQDDIFVYNDVKRVINMNGHSLTFNNDCGFDIGKYETGCELSFTGEGIITHSSSGNYGCIYVRGCSTDNGKKQIINIGEGITTKNPTRYAIHIGGTNVYGLEINYNGTDLSAQGVFSINGQIHTKGENCFKITFDHARLSGFYLAGFAKLTMRNCIVNSYGTSLLAKAGEIYLENNVFNIEYPTEEYREAYCEVSSGQTYINAGLLFINGQSGYAGFTSINIKDNNVFNYIGTNNGTFYDVLFIQNGDEECTFTCDVNKYKVVTDAEFEAKITNVKLDGTLTGTLYFTSVGEMDAYTSEVHSQTHNVDDADLTHRYVKNAQGEWVLQG